MIAVAAPPRTMVVRYQNAQDLLKAWKVTGLSGWIKQQMRAQTPKGQDDHPHSAKNE
jgi:hypothetical protein